MSEEQLAANWNAIFPPKASKTGYSERYDAKFDTMTREWLESACEDPGCGFCADLPEKA